LSQPRWIIRRLPVEAVLGLLHGVAFAQRFVIAPLAPSLERTFQVTDAGFGVAAGPVLILPYALTLFAAGRWLKPTMARRTVAWSLMICAVGDVAGACAGPFAGFLASRGLLGAGEAVFDAAAFVLLADLHGKSGRAFALFAAGSIVGKALALSGSGWLLALFTSMLGAGRGGVLGWRLVLFAFALMSGAASLARLPPTAPRPDFDESERPAGPEQHKLPLRRHLEVMLPAGAGVFASQALATFVTVGLARRFAVPPSEVGEWLGGLLLAAGLIGSSVGGELATRARRLNGVSLTAPLVAVVGCTVWLWRSPDARQALLGMFSALLCLCMLAPLGLEALRRSAGPAGGRLLSAYVSVATVLAFSVGPPLIGFMAGELRPAGSGATLTAMCGVITFVCLLGAAGGVGLRLTEIAQNVRRPAIAGDEVSADLRPPPEGAVG
jgi:predicted MFS family arabinose efflux permease